MGDTLVNSRVVFTVDYSIFPAALALTIDANTYSATSATPTPTFAVFIAVVVKKSTE